MAIKKKLVDAGEVVNLSDKYSMPKEMLENINSVGWDTIANLAADFKVDLGAEGAQGAKLAKEIEMTRMIVVDRLKSHTEGTVALDAKFLVTLVRLLETLEAKEKKHNVKLRNFMNFIYLLVEKMKREKLVVFDRMQGKYLSSFKSKGLGLSQFGQAPAMEKPLK